MRFYLAGPEVFLPDATEIGMRKRNICAQNGVAGAFPLDNEISFDGKHPHDIGMTIYRSNIDLMRSCDAIIANLTPFRGPSADPGTAFEVGFMAALERPVFAYTNSPHSFIARVAAWCGPLAARADGTACDNMGYAIEQFDMPDNLMLAGAAECLGHPIILSDTERPLGDTTVFEICVRLAAAQLNVSAGQRSASK